MRHQPWSSIGNRQSTIVNSLRHRRIPMGAILQDLKYGLRMLVKNPGFTAIAVISLGLGIGANTTILTFVTSLLFRPPPMEPSAKLSEVWNETKTGPGLE